MAVLIVLLVLLFGGWPTIAGTQDGGCAGVWESSERSCSYGWSCTGSVKYIDHAGTQIKPGRLLLNAREHWAGMYPRDTD
jgi:hypothetical protein